MAREEAPPLWSFALAALFVVLALIAFGAWAVVEDPYQAEDFERFHRERLAAFTAGGGDAYTVIAIGRSSLMTVLPEADVLAGVAHERGLDLRLLEIGAPHSLFRDLSPLLDALRAAPPDLLLFELSMLVEERTLATRLKRKRGYLDWRLFGEGPWMPLGLTPEEFESWQPECDGTVVERDRRARERFPKFAKERRFHRTIDATSRNAGAARAFLRDLVAAGVRVAAVSTPRRPAVESEFGLWADPGVRDYLTLLAGDGVELWRYEQSLGGEHFCDLTHLSPPGRELFLAWLLDRIAEPERAAARAGG